MHHFIKFALVGSVLSVAAFAADPAPTPVPAPAPSEPWAVGAIDLQTGALWEIGTGTPFHYSLIITQLSWRSKAFMTHVFADGSRIIVRHRLTLLGDVVLNGPESHYLGFSGSPSLEWWDKAGKWSLYTGSGGGFGLIDSRGIKGGQGQDFTLNWFIRGGIEHVMANNRRLNAGIMYQHMSNGGMTKPNPGIDALGFTVGYTWTY